MRFLSMPRAALAALFFCIQANALDFGVALRRGDLEVIPVRVQPNLILSGVSDHEAIAVVLNSRSQESKRYRVTVEYAGRSVSTVVLSVVKDGGSSAVAWFDVFESPKKIDTVTVSTEEVFQ